jgi:hypothetical protein
MAQSGVRILHTKLNEFLFSPNSPLFFFGFSFQFFFLVRCVKLSEAPPLS